MVNEILVQGAEVVIICQGELKDFEGKIIKIVPSNSGEPRYKVRIDKAHGPGSKSTFYRWLDEKDLIPKGDPAYGLIFG